MAKPTAPKTPVSLTFNEVHTKLSAQLLIVENDINMTPGEKSLALKRLSQSMNSLARTRIYATNSSHKGPAPANLHTVMKMPVFR